MSTITKINRITTLRIAVCDDQPIFIREFSRMLSAYFQKRRLDFSLTSFLDGSALLHSGHAFDIIFLDIKMQGLSGLETAQRLRKSGISSRLVFLTAYKEYVFQAFDVDASHYLIKPVHTEKLSFVLNHLIKQLDEADKASFTFKCGNIINCIPLYKIFYFEVINRKIFLHMEKETLEFYEKLEHLEKQLKPLFFRCHRSYLVNLDFVMRFDKTEILLLDNEKLPLSKRKYELFSEAFYQNLRKDFPHDI